MQPSDLARLANALRPFLANLTWLNVEDDGSLTLKPTGPFIRMGHLGPGIELRKIYDYNSDGTPFLDAGGEQQYRYGLFVRTGTGVAGIGLLSGTQANPESPAVWITEGPTLPNVPELPFAVEQRVGMTPDGGLAVLATAGENLVRGEVVYVKLTGGADGKVYKTIHTDGESIQMPVGFVYANASANAYVWIVTNGVAYALPESGVTAARGNVVFCSNAESGRVEQSATVPVAEHWRECGHWLDTGSGAGALARLLIHFN